MSLPRLTDVRYVERRVRGLAASDGAGVELHRVIGQPALDMLDPFLLLDVFSSDRPNDYIAGFPPHPHRGFETVTYLLAGRMRHRDSAGHEGVIEPGGVQWMTAGRGIVHSEMPEQQDGLLAGFQLWVNLPAAHKFDAPRYQEFPAAQVPLERRGAVAVRVIAGRTSMGTQGPVVQALTDPLYLDVALPSGGHFHEPVGAGYAAFIYMIDGDADLPGRAGAVHRVDGGTLAVLSAQGSIALSAGDAGARLLVVAGMPLGEPVARRGPFVMNSVVELRQAFADYQTGKMGVL